MTPYLLVDDIDDLVGFLERAFDARLLRLMRRADGSVADAEVQIGTSRIMMGSAREDYPAMPAMFYMYVPDADASHGKAVAAGGESVMEPADMYYGDRSGGVADPAGNQWWIATRLEDLSPDEMQRRRKEAGK